MKGRKPTPTALKVLRGNPGRRPLNENEPQPPADDEIPDPPWGMSPRAKTQWKRLTKMLHPVGLLKTIDHDALARYCEIYVTWRDAQKRLHKEGMTVIGADGVMKQSPLIFIVYKSVEQLNKLAIEFGMTPSSRSRVSVEQPKKKPAGFRKVS